MTEKEKPNRRRVTTNTPAPQEIVDYSLL